MLYHSLDVEVLIHKSSEVGPTLDIVKCWRSHHLIRKDYFAEVHELIDLDGLTDCCCRQASGRYQ